MGNTDKIYQKIESNLFDLSYLLMNCDFDQSEEEKRHIKDVLNDLDDDEKKIVKKRIKDLDRVVDKGLYEIKQYAINSSNELNDLVQEKEMKVSFLNLMKHVIYLDGLVHENEKILLDEMMKIWDIQIKLE